MKYPFFFATYILLLCCCDKCIAQGTNKHSGEQALASYGKAKQKVSFAEDSAKPKSMYVIEATSPEGVKKRVRPNLDELTYEGGAGLVYFTGGHDAPFTGGVGLNIGIINPWDKKHVAIEYLLAVDYCTGPSKNWYARSVATSPSNITSMSAGYNMDLGFAVSAIIINKQKLAVIVGPEFMFQSIALSKIKVATGDKELMRQLLISFAPGVKATAYIGNQLTANLEYSACLKSNVEYDDYSNYPFQTQSTAINLKLLRLGVGLRF